MKAPGKARPPRRRRGFGDEESFAAPGTRSDHVQSLVRALGIINQLASADEGRDCSMAFFVGQQLGR